MSDIFETFEKRTAGTWLKAENVDVGETFTVEDMELDEETFAPKTYIIAHCVADATNENRKKGDFWKARLGPEAFLEVKAVLGKDWIGFKLKVVKIKTYPGLGKSGIIWTGVKVVEQEKMTPSPTQPTRNARARVD